MFNSHFNPIEELTSHQSESIKLLQNYLHDLNEGNFSTQLISVTVALNATASLLFSRKPPTNRVLNVQKKIASRVKNLSALFFFM